MSFDVPMVDVYDKEIRPFLDLIDEFRQIGVQNDSVELPQICVMGDQSSGKSSVLQAISGIPFPRGSGLVTRCPTQLIMSKSPEGSKWTAKVSLSRNNINNNSNKYANNKKEETVPEEYLQPVYSPVELTARIAQLTDILTSNEANSFSTDSIVIHLSSPSSPDLTIIDLPGIVRTTTSGQQANVISQVNDLINYYINQPRTIILAVIPANQDIATIDILERASLADPQGTRTIGVLTKPDLVSPGGEDEVLSVVTNKRKPLLLGYIMVKNLSQKDINDGIDEAKTKELERKYFENHEIYSKLPPNLLGTDNLIVLLTKVLVSNIKRFLPDIKAELEQQHEFFSSELLLLGKGVPEELSDRQTLVMDLIASLCRVIRQSCHGDYREGILSVKPETRLHSQMQTTYTLLQHNIMELKPAPFTAQAEKLIAQLNEDLISMRGRELICFHSSQVLIANIIALVEAWRPSLEGCKEDIFQLTKNVTVTIIINLISTLYPQLASQLSDIAANIINSLSEDVSIKLESLITREQDPYTSQYILLDVVNKLRFRAFDTALLEFFESVDMDKNTTKQQQPKRDPNKFKEEIREKFGAWYMEHHGVNSLGNMNEMVTLIQAYWDVASRRFIDTVCMCLETELTSKFVSELESQYFLYAVSLSDDELALILSESPEVEKQRTVLQNKVKRLSLAVEALKSKAPEIVSTTKYSKRATNKPDNDSTGSSYSISNITNNVAHAVSNVGNTIYNSFK